MDNKNYDTVLIIGNGFDLNLKLKTGYPDFIESKHFKELLINDNEFAKYLNEKKGLNNWIDIENELKIYSNTGPVKDRFILEFKSLKRSLIEYLKTLDYENINQESPAYRLIEQVSKEPALIIDYNYTPTITNIFTNLNGYFNIVNPNIKHVKIHGSTENKDIIFGVEDSANISPHHIFLKKSVHKNFDRTDYSSLIENCTNLIVFGHSLGETDHSYFSEFLSQATFKSRGKKTHNILLFHYGEEGYNNLFAQLDTLTRSRISGLKYFNNVDTIDVQEYDLKKEVQFFSQPS